MRDLCGVVVPIVGKGEVQISSMLPDLTSGGTAILRLHASETTMNICDDHLKGMHSGVRFLPSRRKVQR
jgi:hypothetical protein